MAIPTISESFVPTLAYLYQKNSPVHISELKEIFREHFKPSEKDLMETTQTGHNRFDNRAHWAVVYLKQAELVDRPKRGCAQITEFGREFFENNPAFSLKTLKEKTRYLENEASYKRNNEAIPDTIEDENISLANIDYYESIEEELLRRLKNMGNNSTDKGSRFEKLCLQLLEALGYGEPEQIGGAGDRGIDGFLTRDSLGFERIGVQCKCYSEGKVDDNEITKCAHGLKNVHGCTKGVFITTSDFHPRARKAAEETKDVKIILIHGVRLAKLMREKKIGVSVRGTNYIYDITIGENT